MDLSKLMQSTVTPYLLLIACEDNQQLEEETRDVIRSLFDTIRHKLDIKIIFITPLGGSIAAFLHHLGRRLSGNGFVRGFEELTWSDLTTSSQEKLLEKSVKFQGIKISLNELMSAESPVAKFLSLGDLLKETELKIADPVPVSNGYNESYYIGRTFCIQRAIKQDIFNDKDVRNSSVFLARSEQEYKQLCQLNPKSNVHWLEKDKAGNLLWQQSQGSLETVRRYIDTHSSHTYTDDDLVKLLEQAEQQRVMLISDTAGMGKSTALTQLSRIIKRTSPAKWVLRVDLNDHTDVLKVLKEEQFDKEKAIEFVSERLLKLKPGLELELFKQCCEQKEKVRIVIMLDGCDEISPFYKRTVIGLLQALMQTAVEQLWVTTRPHLNEELEDKLLQLSYTLQPFSEENKVEFLTKFWGLKDQYTEMNSEEKEERKKKLGNYAKELLEKLARSAGD
jgi:NTP pyrophosphatase (non-canonical NTP hydrolase)